MMIQIKKELYDLNLINKIITDDFRLKITLYYKNEVINIHYVSIFEYSKQLNAFEKVGISYEADVNY